jgi:hypothetical protein
MEPKTKGVFPPTDSTLSEMQDVEQKKDFVDYGCCFCKLENTGRLLYSLLLAILLKKSLLPPVNLGHVS